jgi:thiamine-phosphate pyrophosphorylase
MGSKKDSSRGSKVRDFKLYVIIDGKTAKGRDLVTVTREAIAGGADVIQLREKELPAGRILELARAIRKAIRTEEAVFLINDRPDIALAAGADGVHLGQDDIPPEAARAIMGRDKIIGVSTHCLEQARAAEEKGVDYIGVGPVFSTPTKPGYKSVGLELIRSVKDAVKLPFVAIGGIEGNNILQVIAAGAARVAVVRAVCGADDVQAAARTLKESLMNK